jgi:hypothetical protein
MMAQHLMMQIELSLQASESLGRLTAEICALRDRLEQLEVEDAQQIAEAIRSCIYHLLILQNGMKVHK